MKNLQTCAHNPMGGHLRFHFLCQVIPFSYKFVNVAITCPPMRFSRWPPILFLRVSMSILMNHPAFELLVTLQTRFLSNSMMPEEASIEDLMRST